MKDISNYQNLLSQVLAINERYKRFLEATGENFNVFRILKLEASEVRLHSAFIAELLNPRGSHGQKDTFLKMFLRSSFFGERHIDVDTASCEIEIEKHVAVFRTGEGAEGGRIDISITDRNHRKIIIENKIYAADQDQQLMRYKAHAPYACLIYLTLDGKEPGKGSKGNLTSGIDYLCVSYKTDIIQWLETCRKEASVFPLLRESISQYINLIKYLTNQAMDHSMNEELSNLILGNLEASFLIANNLDNSLLPLVEKLKRELAELAQEFKLDLHFNLNLERNYTGFWFNDVNWKYYHLAFEFQNFDKKLIYGIVKKSTIKPESIPAEILQKMSGMQHNLSKSNRVWPIYDQLNEPYNDWSKHEAWEAIQDGTMAIIVREKVVYLYNLFKDLQLYYFLS